MTKEKKTFVPPTQEEIAAYAYQLWEADGRRDGRDMDHWLQAQAHLTADRQYEAGLLSRQAQAAPVVAQKAESSLVKAPPKTDRRKKIEIRSIPGAKHSAFA